ncbi:hypothetical protein N7519_011694 [Penicillium mononematosum]|uniref:uncharacterized protein n=1 Tax=Penicillium mononematosum TaxID=268346 RepID=UPI002548C87D|nr:uncharacterized protein N7519_011694 [Penicillium mononematosum]KAJ6181233.1 hypothetical protein N7519_011694 [Penicillium mononematosum]
MEHLFLSFIRIILNLGEPARLLATFQEFESNPSAISVEDRVRFLDFPDFSTQEANISAGRLSFPEEDIRFDYFDNLTLVSDEHYSEILERLETSRSSFYAEFEADAFKTLEAEVSR